MTISKNIITNGEIPAITDFEKMNSRKIQRLILKDGKYLEDNILDDQAIFLNRKMALSLLLVVLTVVLLILSTMLAK